MSSVPQLSVSFLINIFSHFLRNPDSILLDIFCSHSKHDSNMVNFVKLL